MSQIDKASRRQKIKDRSRVKVHGTMAKPRLCVYRSLSQIYAQLIDDDNGKTIMAVSSMSKENKALEGTKSEVCTVVGKQLAEMALAKGITTVVFDRNGFRYHGRLKALAEGAREAGLVF
ncbi:50S ribosomal protein L18 [Chlorobium phaeobacteroides]|jgi:large subunit ribosomal protein L18|uniref:Large ribosomal subunit protein uL18 n=1 Tax=Chlorobium phaeobacteroides (strain DSM 266 / SMG 266 / 2430) TaxID=290317 RepID=RL18_CHLPD|nr:50S ribosomal protein L18 [Chlorobium phaeobacteroides]A1BJ18.1 RecName: Full=Large ribosomal subunit protein uL18; AltName: Full=50S ribosomal protein L18 [Chlorobium phaeobacteroides DSM 266]ABL66395.1 LSU ribosomal protein L18P [Chlorobium phaeobacteroides DSM 266]MBV5319578.1 50S ribosomal protein L18 [Chlorobium phaeobacteroides]